MTSRSMPCILCQRLRGQRTFPERNKLRRWLKPQVCVSKLFSQKSAFYAPTAEHKLSPNNRDDSYRITAQFSTHFITQCTTDILKKSRCCICVGPKTVCGVNIAGFGYKPFQIWKQLAANEVSDCHPIISLQAENPKMRNN